MAIGRKRSSSLISEDRTGKGSLDLATGRLVVPRVGADSEVGGVQPRASLQPVEGWEGTKRTGRCRFFGSLAEKGGKGG